MNRIHRLIRLIQLLQRNESLSMADLRRANGRDWELRLEPPVNRVIPVARGRVAALWAAYGDEVRDSSRGRQA